MDIDPSSPIPLYHQIAQRIRERIESGQLAPGDALQPLRLAARKWKVNLHTVRHAYAALAREGMVEISRGAVGTRVAPGAVRPVGRPDPGPFLEGCVREARQRFGLNRDELVIALRDMAPPSSPNIPVVYVMECSEHQCATHAREIAARFSVDARPWPLDRGEPPHGSVIATFFHYNDIRRQWPQRLDGVRFLTIRPHPALRARLEGVAGELRVCERDPATAAAVVGDLQALLGHARKPLVPALTDAPATVLHDVAPSPVLFPPRVWADLDAPGRVDPRSIELVYVFDERELDRVAAEWRWARRPIAAAG
jgi:DNA-binding transcriptional regulator YhcF (GntR family)